MKLTNKELEVMAVLWEKGVPMSATEILAASDNRTWVETSIFIMLKNLLVKGAVSLADYRATATKRARLYLPTVSFEEVMAHHLIATRKDKFPGLPFDEDKYIDAVKNLMTH